MRDSLEAQRLASLLISCSVTSGPASTRPSGLTITLPRRISMVCGSADRLPGSPDNPRDNRRDEYIGGPRVLAARRVGPTGKAYGLDMTDEMLALAEENRRKSGLTNVEFLKGEIEFFPLSRSPSRRRISLQR